jgi:hypothetical protein
LPIKPRNILPRCTRYRIARSRALAEKHGEFKPSEGEQKDKGEKQPGEENAAAVPPHLALSP